LILSAFENQLRAGLVYHTMQTNPAVEQNKNIKWSENRKGKGIPLLTANLHTGVFDHIFNNVYIIVILL